MKKALYSIALLTSFSSFAAHAQTNNYTITDINPPTGTSSVGYGISSNGLVTGFFQDGSQLNAFLYDGYTTESLSTSSINTSMGFGINNSGQVVGSNSDNSFLHYDGTTINGIGSLGGSGSYGYYAAINDAGQFTGVSHLQDNTAAHAFLYDSGNLQDLGTLGGTNSQGFGINSQGHVTGYSETSENTQHAFIHNGSSMMDIGTLGGGGSHGYDLNDNGWVTGVSTNALGISRAFFYDGTTMQDLGTLSSSELGRSHGYGINNSGQIVGTSSYTAFLYENNTMHNLCSLVDCQSSGWLSLNSANAINNNGDIVGTGNYQGEERAFLIKRASSVPEPATLLLTLTGLIGTLGISRRRKTLIKINN